MWEGFWNPHLGRVFRFDTKLIRKKERTLVVSHLSIPQKPTWKARKEKLQSGENQITVNKGLVSRTHSQN